MKSHVITFGCQINQSDSERIEKKLKEMKYKSASDISEADLIVVNMCSVRQAAVDRVYGRIRQIRKLKTKTPNLKTILTGCILTQDIRKLGKEFDYVLSVKSLPDWKDVLDKKQGFVYYPNSKKQRKEKVDTKYFQAQPIHQNKFSAFIPISTGCDEFCSYCVVPHTRGPLASRPYQELLEEIKNTINQGFKEIWLLGQNVNSYKSGKVNFAELLRKIDQIPGDFWVSFTSSHPKDFTDELIQVVKSCEKVSKYISLPIQSGDDEILKKMNRSYTVKQFTDLIKKIRKEIPDVCISTDIIVGFPGEIRKQFNNTKKIYKKLGFDMGYISKYSPRPQTTASKMKDNVSKKEKQKRWEELTKILEKNALKHNKKYVGQTFNVLIQETKKESLIGKTKFYKTVKIPCKKDCKKKIGTIQKVIITKTLAWGLKGKEVP